MPRIRSIHPDACDSEKLSLLPDSAERLFWRLITHADDEGRGEDRPRLLASKLYPLNDEKDAAQVNDDLDALDEVGLLVRYRVDGKSYFTIPTFGDWQKPRHPSPSKIPSVDDADPEPDPNPTADHGTVTAERGKPHAGVGGVSGGGEGGGESPPGRAAATATADPPAWRRILNRHREELNGKASYDLLAVYRKAGRDIVDDPEFEPPALIPLVVAYVEELLGEQLSAPDRSLVAKTVRRNGLISLFGWDKALGATEEDSPRARMAYANGVINRMMKEAAGG